MHCLPISNLSMIEEDEAAGEVSDLYTKAKRDLDWPFVPNILKAMAISPVVLDMCIDIYHTFFQNTSLPQSLVAMISYCIPAAKNCTYCAATGELHCRTLGIDEDMLEMLAKDLGNVSPKRVQAVIEFALKCALDPQALVTEDYERVRHQGVGNEEIVEIIFIAAMANFSDTLADGLKVEVDELVAQALGR